MRTLIVLFLLVLPALGLWAALETGRVPARWNPWAEPDPTQKPGLLTAWQLKRLGADPAACFAWLERAGASAIRLPDRDNGRGCGLDAAGRLTRTAGSVGFGGPVTATCPILSALTLWERHVLQPAAEQHLGSSVASVRHLGTYACRDIRSTRTPVAGLTGNGRRSEHAMANAIDIGGITLADGRRLSVIRDWDRQGPDGQPTPEALFWRDLRDGACRLFKVVLSPDYNALHRDHLHLDMGPYSVCR